VGERAKPYKNWALLIDAVAASEPGIRLACFGPPGTVDEQRLLDARGLHDRVRFVGGNDRDLARMYGAAAALVYPSHYEGFGLPPLEAMAHGCPVVSARAGAMPEVLDDAALFFDPTDVDDLGHALARVLTDTDEVARLRARGRERASTFTWERTVDETLRGYRAIAG
jgi:glycosyltransferase involved in cell wall biosynthesis